MKALLTAAVLGLVAAPAMAQVLDSGVPAVNSGVPGLSPAPPSMWAAQAPAAPSSSTAPSPATAAKPAQTAGGADAGALDVTDGSVNDDLGEVGKAPPKVGDAAEGVLSPSQAPSVPDRWSSLAPINIWANG